MVNEITLKNGLRIIGEKMPGYRSVSVGVWVRAGSQYETPEINGITHFIEHMLFKGTSKRTAKQIAEEMDAVGGQMNAFTSKECTCFYAKVVDEHLPLAVDVLCDMIRNPLFDPADIEKEKGVVLEEIDMAEDTPEDAVSELAMIAQFGDQPVSRPILGTDETVSSLTREAIVRYYSKMYRPETIVISLAGNYDWEEAVNLIAPYFDEWNGNTEPIAEIKTEITKPEILRKEKDIEQLHICIGYPGVKIGSEKVYPLSVFNSVFGGAMSSRLFQRIREEKGMVYTVYSYAGSYTDCGSLTVYAGTGVENATEVMSMIREEALQIARNGLTEEEFIHARDQLKAGVILGGESTSSRMSSIGRRKLLMNDVETEEAIIAKIDAITREQVNKLAAEILGSQASVAVLGKGAGDVVIPF